MTSSPRARSRFAQCMPMKPATPVTSTFTAENGDRPHFSHLAIAKKWGLSPFSPAVRFAQLDQLGVLQVAVHAADRDVQQPRNAVEKPEAQHVELEEAHQWRGEKVRDPGAEPALVGLARGERGVAVLALEIGGEVVGGVVQQVALERARR